MGLCDFKGDALEVFSGVVGWGDGEELLPDVEVEALAAGEEDLVGVRFEVEFVDEGEAVTASEFHVGRGVEVEDVVSESRSVESSVALEGVALF